jgi:hypothetical protein
MRERSKTLNIDAPEFRDYRRIVSRLRDEFEVGVYNLNYDNVAIGFHHGKFDARAVSIRKEWEFIYHLHGSVHNSLAAIGAARVVVWENDLNSSNFNDSDALWPNMAEEGKPLVPSTLIAGAFKFDQLLADPFQTFYASLIRHAHEADAVWLLVTGLAIFM